MKSGLTRRGFLRAGGVAGAAAAVGATPFADALAAGPTTHSPLRRSSYTSLRDTGFSVDGVGLRLVSVSDLPAAANVKQLAGSEDAFSLVFSGPTGTELLSGPHNVSNRELGRHTLFISPVERPGDQQLYEVVVNRLPEKRPKPPAPKRTPARKPPRKPKLHVVRRVRARRLRRAIAFHFALAEKVHVKTLTVWLMRGDRLVAAGSRRHVRGKHHVSLKLPTKRRLRSGHYMLYVQTKDRHGNVDMKRQRIKLG
jgi:hypothetical protein